MPEFKFYRDIYDACLVRAPADSPGIAGVNQVWTGARWGYAAIDPTALSRQITEDEAMEFAALDREQLVAPVSKG